MDRVTSHVCDLAVFDRAVSRSDKFDGSGSCNRTADAPEVTRPVPRRPRSLSVSKAEPGKLHVLDETSRLRLAFKLNQAKYLPRHNHLCSCHVLAGARYV